MTADFEVGFPGPDDHDIVPDIRHASIRGLCGSYYTAQEIDAWLSPQPPSRRTRRWQPILRFVARQDALVIGYADMEDQTGWVRAMYVRPEAAGRGVGTALLRRLEEAAREEGLPILRLESSLNAVNFYRNRGFHPDGETCIVMAGGTSLRCVRMIKAMAP